VIPIQELVAVAETLLPKIQELIPTQHQEKIKEIITQHKQDLVDTCTKIQDAQPTKDVMQPIKESGWLGTYWIPILMALLLLIIGTNYLLIPIINFFHPTPLYQLPSQFWTLILVTVPAHLGFKSLDKHLDNIGNSSKEE